MAYHIKASEALARLDLHLDTLHSPPFLALTVVEK
jgi:hypothetical protein